MQFDFIVFQTEGYQNIFETKLILPHIKLFQKTKRGLGDSLPASFFALILKKNISLVIFY